MLRPYKRFRLQILFLIMAPMGLWLNALGADRPDGSGPGKAEGAAAISRGEVLTLEQCLDRALQKNHRRAASKFELAMAEAQHRQALARYWPQVKTRVAYQLLDQGVTPVESAILRSSEEILHTSERLRATRLGR
jgi:outer membrane protein TolC